MNINLGWDFLSYYLKCGDIEEEGTCDRWVISEKEGKLDLVCSSLKSGKWSCKNDLIFRTDFN